MQDAVTVNVFAGIKDTFDPDWFWKNDVPYAALIAIGVASRAASHIMQFYVIGVSIPSCSKSFLNHITSTRTLSCDKTFTHARHVPVGCRRAEHRLAFGIAFATLSQKSSHEVQPDPSAVILSQALAGSHLSLLDGLFWPKDLLPLLIVLVWLIFLNTSSDGAVIRPHT